MKLFLTVALSLMMIAWVAHAQQMAPGYPPPPGPPAAGYSPPPPAPPTMAPEAPPPGAAQMIPPPPSAMPAPQQAVTPVPVPSQASPPSALQAQQQGNITFVSGGAGDEDRTALKQVESQYNVRLLFAARDGAFLANIGVTLADARGATVLDTISDGPIFYAHVPPGRYRLTVSNQGQTQTRDVTVSAGGVVHQDFYWAAG